VANQEAEVASSREACAMFSEKDINDGMIRVYF